MEGMSRLELIKQSVPITRSVARPGGGSMKEFTNWDAVSHPVADVNPDGRPMEGTTYLEHSAPGVSLDSGLMEGMSRPELLEQSVLLVVRPEETDTPERPALASQVNHGQSHLKSRHGRCRILIRLIMQMSTQMLRQTCRRIQLR